MKVAELIEILSEEFDENDEIVIADFQRFSDYAYKVGGVAKVNVRAFYGSDFKAVGIVLGSQVGGVSEEEEDY